MPKANGIEYELVRSRRKTTAIKVEDCSVKVYAPYAKSVASIEEFLVSKTAWIKRNIAKQKAAAEKVSAACDEILLFGKKADYDGPRDVKAVRAFYFGRLNCLADRMLALAGSCGFKYRKLGFTDARKQWGNCDSQNNIRLNWRLLALPISLSDYVMIHELAHTKFHNHQREFWDEVEKFVPDWKKRRKQLKGYGWLLESYR